MPLKVLLFKTAASTSHTLATSHMLAHKKSPQKNKKAQNSEYPNKSTKKLKEIEPWRKSPFSTMCIKCKASTTKPFGDEKCRICHIIGLTGPHDFGIFSYLMAARGGVQNNELMMAIIARVHFTADMYELLDALCAHYKSKHKRLKHRGQHVNLWYARLLRVDRMYDMFPKEVDVDVDVDVDDAETNFPMKHLTLRTFVPRCPYHREDSRSASSCEFCELIWLHGPYYQHTFSELLSLETKPVDADITWQHERLIELFFILDQGKITRCMLQVYFGRGYLDNIKLASQIGQILDTAIQNIKKIKAARPAIQDWEVKLQEGRRKSHERVGDHQCSNGKKPFEAQCPAHYGAEKDDKCDSCFLCRFLSPSPVERLAHITKVARSPLPRVPCFKEICLIGTSNLSTTFLMLQQVFPMSYQGALKMKALIDEVYLLHIESKHVKASWWHDLRDLDTTDDTITARKWSDEDFDLSNYSPN